MEILKFRRSAGLLKEGIDDYPELYSDVKKLVSIASDELKQTEDYKKLTEFFNKMIPDSFKISLGDRETKSLSKNISDFSTSDDDFYESILKCIGAPITKDNMLFFYAWRQAEGGKAAFNPFNTTRKKSGAKLYGKNVAGVKHYPSKEDGIDATCETLKLPYYEDIVNGLKNDVGLHDLSRMKSLETWGTGELLAKVADGYIKGSKPGPDPIYKTTS